MKCEKNLKAPKIYYSQACLLSINVRIYEFSVGIFERGILFILNVMAAWFTLSKFPWSQQDFGATCTNSKLWRICIRNVSEGTDSILSRLFVNGQTNKTSEIVDWSQILHNIVQHIIQHSLTPNNVGLYVVTECCVRLTKALMYLMHLIQIMYW